MSSMEGMLMLYLLKHFTTIVKCETGIRNYYNIWPAPLHFLPINNYVS